MIKYCADLDLPISLFKSTLEPIEFLKLSNPTSARHYKISNELLSDAVVTFFADHRLTINFIEVFYRPAGVNSSIHIDTQEPGDYVKLNWVFGGEGSTMCWYSIKENCQGAPQKTSISTYAIHYAKDDVTLLHSQKVGQPTLVQVGIPHSINNNNLTERFCVSIIFGYRDQNGRPTFDNVYEIFKNYIKQ
jgi:hypothetical protein